MKNKSIVFYTLFFAMGAANSLIGIFVPLWSKIFSLNASNLGLILSLPLGAGLISGIIAGWQSDRGHKPLMLKLGSLFLALGMFLMGLSILLPGNWLWVLLIGLVIDGLGFGFMNVAGTALCAEVSQPDSRKALGFLNFSYAAGAIASPAVSLIAGQGREDILPFLIVFIALYGFVHTLKLSSSGLLVRKNDFETKKGFSKVKLGLGFLILAVATDFLYSGIEGGISGWLPYYWTTSQLDVKTYFPSGSIAMVFWVFFTIGRLMYARFAENFSVAGFIAAASGGLAVMFLVWLLTGPGVLLFLLVALFGLGCAGIFPALITATTARHPEATGLVTSIIMITSSVGGIFWPAVTGWGLDHVGTYWLILLLLSAGLGIFILSFFWKKKSHV